MTETLHNWAGNITFGAKTLREPRTVRELQEIVRGAGKVRVLGSGHSFNRIADTDDTLISLARLERRFEIDPTGHTVTIDGGSTYAQVVEKLHAAGYALGNVASLPHITVAGAVATATHGSGDTNQNLAAAVQAITLVTATGELKTWRRGEPDFDGVVVSLGALGVVAELTLDLKPSFEIRQNIYLDLPVDTLLANFAAVQSRAYSVSLFTRWRGDAVDQVWIKSLAGDDEPATDFHGARAADKPYHPIPDMDGATCTVQMGVAGPWHERLFHFPVGHKASAGAELQSEYFVSRADASAAFKALHAVQERFAGPLFISEVRSIAGDDLWLSTAHGQDSVGFHFTWKPDAQAVEASAGVIEAALAPFGARPHWAKVFTTGPGVIAGLYPRLDDFRALADRLDREGKFRNRFVETTLFGEG